MEFMGSAFQQILFKAGIRGRATGVQTPTANAICEQIHQTVANCLLTLIQQTPARDLGITLSLL
jgi:hypothetical protein